MILKIPTVLKLIKMLDQHGSFLYTLVNWTPFVVRFIFLYSTTIYLRHQVDQPATSLDIVLWLKVESLGRSGSNITRSRNHCLERKDTISTVLIRANDCRLT